MEKTTLSRAEKLDQIFGTPVYAVLLAIFCNVLWGSAFPFIKMGYRLFAIDSANTPSILCFAENRPDGHRPGGFPFIFFYSYSPNRASRRCHRRRKKLPSEALSAAISTGAVSAGVSAVL